MTHQPQDTASSVGLENSIRQSWSAGSKVKILSSTSNQWVTAHIVTIHKDWLYCLLEDGDTKKIDRWDASVQPNGTGGEGEDDDDLFWMKDAPSTSDDALVPNQSMSLGFNTLKTINSTPFTSTNIVSDDRLNAILSPTSAHRESIKNIKTIGNALTMEEKQFQKMCGYTIWVQWCDSQELHGYYQCVGLRNNRYHFKHRRDNLAELFADDKGYWYLMYDSKCLYKSKRKGHDDPPPRNWKCIEGSLPPPGVSQVALPDDSTPMVVFDEEKKMRENQFFAGDEADDDGTASNISGVSRQTTVRHNQQQGLQTPKGQHNAINASHSKGKKSKSGKKKKSKKKKNKLDMTKLLMDEFEVAIDVLDFYFDGSKQVAFHLNIGRHMEVTKVKEGGQAEKLGVLQGDILLKIDDEDISKNWEKATNLLRSHVQNKQKFTITFVRRKVEDLIIKVVRAGNGEYNGKYKFYKRDPEDDMCPIYVKNDHDEDFDFSGITQSDQDPLTSNSDSIHIIQRVYANPENSEALWVLKNGKDEHCYMCVTTEYLPPQHGWELVPESEAKYPAPGLTFMNAVARFDHVNRLRGYTTHNNKDGVGDNKMDDDDLKSKPGDVQVHDALNINNRNRTNKHRHEKTLTRMRATLGSANEFNNAAKSSNQRSHTGGASGYMPAKPGFNQYAGGGKKRGGFGSKLFGKKQNKPQKVMVSQTAKSTKSDGNESAPETDEDTAKIEAVWKQRLEATTKNAINQLNDKHADEISKKDAEVKDLGITNENLRNSLAESNEYYYQMYLEKCELSLILQEKQIELTRSKTKQKEMGKRYFESQQRTEELESKLEEISQTFSSRMSAIQAKPKQHRPTKSTVNDLASIEQQFRALLSTESGVSNKLSIDGGSGGGGNAEYLENELIKMREKMQANEDQLKKLKQENQKLKHQNNTLTTQLSSKQGGADQYYQERANKLSAKVSTYQQNIYNLMSLLQNVEQEYMQKCGKLPKVTKAIDWRNEYDPKKYKVKQSSTTNVGSNGTHPTNETFVYNQSSRKDKKKKSKKSKHNGGISATESMTLPHDQRWGGFDLGGSGDEQEPKNNKRQISQRPKPKHRGQKQNESRIIDL